MASRTFRTAICRMRACGTIGITTASTTALSRRLITIWMMMASTMTRILIRKITRFGVIGTATASMILRNRHRRIRTWTVTLTARIQILATPSSGKTGITMATTTASKTSSSMTTTTTTRTPSIRTRRTVCFGMIITATASTTRVKPLSPTAMATVTPTPSTQTPATPVFGTTTTTTASTTNSNSHQTVMATASPTAKMGSPMILITMVSPMPTNSPEARTLAPETAIATA